MKIKQVDGLQNLLDQCAMIPDSMQDGVIPIINGDDSRELISSMRSINDAASPSAYYIWTSSKVNAQILAAQKTVVGIVSKTAGFNLETADAGKYLRYDSVNEGTCTVPPYSTLQIPANTVITIRQAGAGILTMQGGSGVTLNGDLKTGGQHKSLQLIYLGNDVWDVVGGVL